MRPIRGFALSMFASLACAALAGAAGVERQLESIKKKIETEQRGISRVQKREGSVLSALEKIDAELETKNREVKQISARLQSYSASLQKTEAELKSVDSSLRQRRDLLNRRVRALYKWKRGGSSAVLLNGELSLAGFMRARHYLERTLARDQELLDYYRDESARYAELRKEVAQKSAELNSERHALVKVKDSIRLEREKKREFLASLRKEKEFHSQTLKELERSAHRLQKMLDEMSRKSVARSVPSGTGFDAKKGTLEYPVRGEIIETFGKTKHPDFAAEIFRKGVDIEAPLGEEVKAVEAGTVIFADRFSGYGRMMIVDHGQRYYTIYAHLDEIMKRVGETVKKGETIASVGDSDSLKGPRLHFEVRKDGKPVDPMTWLRKR
ncbi:MAG: murein hydrolase activator EnvC family protein [Candidatus Binatia bacterium]